MQDILEFILSLVGHWQTLITGGVVAGLMTLAEHRWRKAIRWKVFLRWVAVAFVVACFYSWRDEHSARLRAEATIKDVSETAALRTRVVTMIRALKAFQLERREIEAAANGSWRPEEETRKLFLQRFSGPLGKLTMELPQSLANEGQLIKESADTPSGGGSRSLEPLLSLLQSVSASL